MVRTRAAIAQTLRMRPGLTGLKLQKIAGGRRGRRLMDRDICTISLQRKDLFRSIESGIRLFGNSLLGLFSSSN